MSDVSAPAAARAAAKPTVADLQAEVEAARTDLVASLNELKGQAQPQALLARGARAVTGLFTDEFGGIRPERVAVAAVVVVGVVALSVLTRRRR